MTNIIIILNC